MVNVQRTSGLGRMLFGGAAFAIAGLMTACSGDDDDDRSNPPTGVQVFYEQKLAWAPCAENGTFECSTMKVPLDYARPDGEAIDIALVRLVSTSGARRPLILNFGGPGESGVSGLMGLAPTFESLRPTFDLVSFDPRGVGRSAPVLCFDDAERDRQEADESTPDTGDEKADAVKASDALAKACQARSGKLLPHVGTIDAARDMDILRAALGREKLDYFGISYGTWLGGVYARHFTSKVGRMVLDGAVDTELPSEKMQLEQAVALDRAFDHFAAVCAAGGCALGRTKQEITKGVLELLRRLDAKPLPTSKGRALTESLAIGGIASTLYSQESWSALLVGLTQAEAGDGTVLLELADENNGRDDDGHYNNEDTANTAITCYDTPDRYTAEVVQAKLPEFKAAAPIFGENAAWTLLQCTSWPVVSDGAARDVQALAAPPIVVIGTTGDPATPYEWAPRLATHLGTGVLVTFEGEGHGAYANDDKACIRQVVDAYLVEGRVPAAGTTCPPGGPSPQSKASRTTRETPEVTGAKRRVLGGAPRQSRVRPA